MNFHSLSVTGVIDSRLPGRSVTIFANGLCFLISSREIKRVLRTARTSTFTDGDAEAQTLAFINQHVGAKDRPVLAGNSIHQDRRFIRKYMPKLVLSVVPIDGSSPLALLLRPSSSANALV